MLVSPYADLDPSEWSIKTEDLIKQHPLDPKEIVEVVLQCWKSIFDSKIGTHGFSIGKDIFPKPQIMGFLLHELIPLEFKSRYPSNWDIDRTSADKDLVYVPNPEYSVEIKTSSNPNKIFGNRSYAQPSSSDRKSKSGYYITVNFQKFLPSGHLPKIQLVKFGWLDHTDWIPQTSPSGQQARLSESSTKKLQVLYPLE